MDSGDGGRPSAEDVISKLKDDGDFDALRLKIIRKLKDNEDLRNSIISEVKQSVALNRDGAENLKPRQLSDAIHQEIGNKIMTQISDELWKVIRSSDGMQNEIREAVQSVYDKLINPPPKEEPRTSPSKIHPFNANENDQSKEASIENVQSKEASICVTSMSCDSDPDVPPGFAASETKLANSENQKRLHDQSAVVKEEFNYSRDTDPEAHNGMFGFSTHADTKLVGVGTDEDPDVPPGFG